MEFLEILKTGFLRNSLIVLLLCSGMLSFLGVYAVLKRIVFVGIALGAVSSLGYCLGLLMNINPNFCASVASIAGALLFSLHAHERRFPRESLIGLWYIFASGLGIIFVSKSAVAEAGTLNLLFGNALMVSLGQIYVVLGAFLLVGIFFLLFNKEVSFVIFDEDTAKACGLNSKLFEALFYLCLGIAISISISAVGLLVVFSFLVIPALCGLSLGKRFSNVFAIALISGIISCVIGLVVSYQLDLPTGPTIAVVSSILFGISLLLGKRR